jgi:superfamily II DNA/RNA helicase
MRHPVNIRAESADDTQTVPATAQFIYQAHDLDKPEVVARILQAEDRGRVIVFTRTKRQAQRVADDMAERGFKASPLHGDMAQIAREKAMKRFRDGTIEVLVATDVAARGIDVTGVSHVINYTCPEDEKTYLHRIGRTGRAGATGIAITFVDWADLTRWKVINSALGLPFEEPQETYSTSDHLFHDIGIPRDATGRLTPVQRTEEKPAAARTEQRERPARPRNRNRSRTRSGKPLDETKPATDGGSSAPASQPESSMAPASSGGEETTSPTRRRRRRRPGAGPRSED